MKWAAGTLMFVQALWVLYVELVRASTTYACPLNATQYPCAAGVAPPVAGMALALVLIADAGLEFRGMLLAFPAGIALSLGALLLMVLGSNSSYSVADSYVGVVLAVLTIVMNVVSLRRRGRLPEQGNPMNLPVFG